MIRTKPSHQLSRLIQNFKGATARLLFIEFPWLNNRFWKGHLWSPSYCVVTVGGAPIDVVKKYVESQKVK